MASKLRFDLEQYNPSIYEIISNQLPKSKNDLHSFLKILHPDVTLNFTIDSQKEGLNYVEVKPLNLVHIIRQVSIAITNIESNHESKLPFPTVNFITRYFLNELHEKKPDKFMFQMSILTSLPDLMRFTIKIIQKTNSYLYSKIIRLHNPSHIPDKALFTSSLPLYMHVFNPLVHHVNMKTMFDQNNRSMFILDVSKICPRRFLLWLFMRGYRSSEDFTPAERKILPYDASTHGFRQDDHKTALHELEVLEEVLWDTKGQRELKNPINSSNQLNISRFIAISSPFHYENYIMDTFKTLLHHDKDKDALMNHRQFKNKIDVLYYEKLCYSKIELQLSSLLLLEDNHFEQDMFTVTYDYSSISLLQAMLQIVKTKENPLCFDRSKRLLDLIITTTYFFKNMKCNDLKYYLSEFCFKETDRFRND